ncbi:HEPN domain-containing protein [Pseudoflavitalea rhizosphaerae]|uniref:HEPN domain-containing protein n=1 Tax=Pseudoflavitalea rhizosphaerae TaxID=1884793 RepID=UPI000F8D11BE|nr:HEPN domain-containing protein [Pseudoflavitalea rhizosphaerae]
MFPYQPSDALAELVSRMQSAVALDKVFLLGVEVNGFVSSIFCPAQEIKGPASSYFLLLLTREGERRSDDVIVDMLEQRNKKKTPIHLIVYPAKFLCQWMRNGQYFATKVIEEAPLLYDSGITSIPQPDWSLRDQVFTTHLDESRNAFQRSTSFLAAAELFQLRKDLAICAFNLHQAAEHACISFLLRNMGLRSNTHNIDKLLRYSTLISPELNQVFPRVEESDKELFKLLQQAYIHSRYKEYYISMEQVEILMERVKKIDSIVSMLTPLARRA